MPLSATQYLVKPKENKVRKEHFSFSYMAKKVIERQKINKDTIIVIVGERRNGKSNWGLKLVMKYIEYIRKINPDYKWSWKDNFPLTRGQAMDKVEGIPEGSFIVYDEGGDVMYRGDTLSYMNKSLIKFMAKTGKKRLLTLIILPDIYLLDPKILNMAQFLVAVPYRYQDICSFAFIFGRNPNPFVQDKFGLESIKRHFQSKKVRMSLRMAQMHGKLKVKRGDTEVEIPYPKELFAYLRNLPTFLHWHRFTSVEKGFEERYIKFVKDKQLSMKDEITFVKETDYKKMRDKYEVLLYNLYVKQGMTYAQMERMHMNDTGRRLSNAQAIKKAIETATIRFGKRSLYERERSY